MGCCALLWNSRAIFFHLYQIGIRCTGVLVNVSDVKKNVKECVLVYYYECRGEILNGEIGLTFILYWFESDNRKVNLPFRKDLKAKVKIKNNRHDLFQSLVQLFAKKNSRGYLANQQKKLLWVFLNNNTNPHFLTNIGCVFIPWLVYFFPELVYFFPELVYFFPELVYVLLNWCIFYWIGVFFPWIGVFFPWICVFFLWLVFFPLNWCIFPLIGLFFHWIGVFFPWIGVFFPLIGALKAALNTGDSKFFDANLIVV